MKYNEELTLLTEDQIKESKIFLKYGTRAAITDFSILLGGYVEFKNYYTSEGENLEDRCCYYLTSTLNYEGNVKVITHDGTMNSVCVDQRSGAIRPVLLSSSIIRSLKKLKGKSGVKEIQYGEYPQQAVNKLLANILEEEYLSNRLQKTGKLYTTDSRQFKEFDKDFRKKQHEEYEYNGKKYVRVISNLRYSPTVISNGESICTGDVVWVEVLPITWLIDEKKNFAVSKKGIVGGIRFYKSRWSRSGEFKNTEMNMFLQTYLKNDIIPSNVKKTNEEKKKEIVIEPKELEKKRNPYQFDLNQVSEEDIIKGAIESGIAVFLHGEPNEGKSARMKKIDPTCEIIYLSNANPKILNGKCIYNNSTGEMIDIKPNWLKKIEEKCEKEPDKYHILFLNEITNALPSIQGIALNIVLNREVNGIWKLPDNVRIVVAGNEMEDSLAINQLTKPLLNKFAHVYIKTSTNSWLKWASENNIHPAIYAYIAYKKGESLRSEYNGETPNADPRKWEMASQMLYKTGQPQMLRALIGEDITREFVQFCNQKIITLNDIISGNVMQSDIQALNNSEKYATVSGLSNTSEEHVIKVREFVKKIDPEFVDMFDLLWTHNDESKLKIIAEEKLINKKEKVLKKVYR